MNFKGLAFLFFTLSAVFAVDTELVWTTGTAYTTIQVNTGDSITFTWNNGNSDTLKHTVEIFANENDYVSCAFTNAEEQNVTQTSPGVAPNPVSSTVIFNEVGYYYIGCGISDHCTEMNQKVTVIATESKTLAWAVGNTYTEVDLFVGDTLSLTWSGDTSNVWTVPTQDAYDNCDTTDGTEIAAATDNGLVWKLDTAMTYYVLSETGNNCANDPAQKFILTAEVLPSPSPVGGDNSLACDTAQETAGLALCDGLGEDECNNQGEECNWCPSLTVSGDECYWVPSDQGCLTTSGIYLPGRSENTCPPRSNGAAASFTTSLFAVFAMFTTSLFL